MATKILHAALFTPRADRWGLPVLFIGPPGASKSAQVRQYAARVGLPCEILSPGERGEGAFGVVPVPTKDCQFLRYPAPDWTEEVIDGGVVFADEITTAGGQLQAALLGLVSDGRIGSYTLGPRCRIIGACNPPDQAANGNDLSMPLANRFGHMRWQPPTIDEHASYMLGGAGGLLGKRPDREDEKPIDAVTEEARVVAAWPAAWSQAVGLEVAFLRAQTDWKHKMPSPGDPAASGPWPSDRSWEYATRAYAGAIIHGLNEEERDELVTSFIGAAAYEAFATFVEQADMPNAGEVLDGKVKWKHDPQRLDRTAAVLSSCVALAVPKGAEKRSARIAKLWELLRDLGDEQQDITISIARELLAVREVQYPAANEILARMQRVLQAGNRT